MGDDRRRSCDERAGLYYSAAQQLAHHTLSGCRMETGDLLGSGTISGPETRESCGSLLELTWNGAEPIAVDGGTRASLRTGTCVSLTAQCDGPYRIGFGTCEGTILPAPSRLAPSGPGAHRAAGLRRDSR
jgi:fumarylacetoacetase